MLELTYILNISGEKMGQTIAEKILSQHSGKDVYAGELTIAKVDVAAVQDGTGPLTVQEFKKLAKGKLANPNRTILFIDHASPSPRKELGAILSDVGCGVCHQRLVEDFVNPGDVLVGADSHTCTSGALGAFATGMGSTDIAVAFAYGKTWMKVPQTFKIEVNGQFRENVCAKDLILHIIGLIGADGATYKALEFCGSTIENMTMSERFTLSNMAVEAGAKAGLIATDNTTREFLKSRGREDKFVEIKPDPDANYERVIKIDAATIEPTVSKPHTVDNVDLARNLNNVKVNQVYIGTCTNGRIEDLRIAAKIIKGKKIAEGTRLLVSPASKDIFVQALHEGLITDFVEAGATILSPGCGPCVGVHAGILGAGEVCLTTQNRNFKGRMGNTEGFIYLASPYVAACTALAGYITDKIVFA